MEQDDAPKFRLGLKESQWNRIKNLLPGLKNSVGRPAKDNRLFVEAVIYGYRTGCPWRDMPPEFGKGLAIHRRHLRRSLAGIWEKIAKILAEDSDNEYAQIDATIVRARRHSAGAALSSKKKESIGRSRGGLSTKIHAVVDALGNPVEFSLSEGQAHDLEGADELLPGLVERKTEASIADKAYDAEDRVLSKLREKGIEIVIPPKSNRKYQREYDKEKYKWRHLVENFFQKLKQYRGIATRYDKLGHVFLSAVHMIGTIIWLI